VSADQQPAPHVFDHPGRLDEAPSVSEGQTSTAPSAPRTETSDVTSERRHEQPLSSSEVTGAHGTGSSSLGSVITADVGSKERLAQLPLEESGWSNGNAAGASQAQQDNWAQVIRRPPPRQPAAQPPVPWQAHPAGAAVAGSEGLDASSSVAFSELAPCGSAPLGHGLDSSGQFAWRTANFSHFSHSEQLLSPTQVRLLLLLTVT
jgi:hypothetical protein